MIHISVTTAFLIYSTALAAIFLVLYLYTEMGVCRSSRVHARQYLWRCTYCGFTYLDEKAQAVSECPRCGSFNSETDSRPREVRGKPPHPEQSAPVAELVEVRRNPSHRKRPHQRRRGPRRH